MPSVCFLPLMPATAGFTTKTTTAYSLFCFVFVSPLYVIIINVSRDWAIKLLLARGRHDDNEEDINSRLDWYETNVVPAINFFKEHTDYKILEVDGEATIEEVHKRIIESLGI